MRNKTTNMMMTDGVLIQMKGLMKKNKSLDIFDAEEVQQMAGLQGYNALETWVSLYGRSSKERFMEFVMIATNPSRETR